MDSIREQMDLTNEISEAISNPVGMGNMVDEVSYMMTTLLFAFCRDENTRQKES